MEVTDNKSNRTLYGVPNAVHEDETTTAYAIAHGSVEEKSEKSKGDSAVMKKSKEFEKSREEEIKGFIENGNFKLVRFSEIAKEIRIFGSRFIDLIKAADNVIWYRGQLGAKEYGEKDAKTIEMRAPTVRRPTQRLLLSLAASLERLCCPTRDITHAYPQSGTSLKRYVYIGMPHEMSITSWKVLEVVKKLYEIPGSALHWYLTYV